MSNARLATQAPIGTVTRIGWNGWPYGPASEALTGRFAGSWDSLVIATCYFTNKSWSY